MNPLAVIPYGVEDVPAPVTSVRRRTSGREPTMLREGRQPSPNIEGREPPTTAERPT